MRDTFRSVVFCLTLLASVSAFAGQARTVTVLQASSLTELFKRAEVAFETKHPDIDIRREPGASMALARQITDLRKEADIVALADRALMQSILFPKYVENPQDFLREEMSIVVGEKARYAEQINAQNWFDILLKPDVEFGISDPGIAPAGYRALLLWQLAEKHYGKQGLYQNLRGRLAEKNIRPNATALMTLLKTGELDYVFDYPSLAGLQGLRVVLLPPQINLGDPRYADLYKTVSVEIAGEKPGMTRTIVGEPIIYSIGVLKDSPNREAAQAFLDFLLGAEGKSIMKNLGMTPVGAGPKR